jgi:nucleotide-binding universal stress UspA family protein
MTTPIRRMVVGVGLLGRHDPVLRIAAGIAREHAVEGTASECLVDRTREIEADLLIVGATRQDRVRRHFVGTTAQGVIAEGVVPVLLIWQPVVRPLKRVLLASNLSDQGTQICGRGLEILRSLFPDDLPELRCLLALRPPDRDAEGYLAFAQGELRRSLRGFPPVEPRIRQGDPGECIVREAVDWRADLVVLGNHAHAGRRRGIGGVAGMVLREAARNVLIIPAPHVQATPEHRTGTEDQKRSDVPHGRAR